MQRFVSLTLGLLAAGLIAGCPYVEQPSTLEARFQTSAGDITVELNPDAAPLTVANFVQYADEGFYAGTVFHRVLANFVVQGGGFTENLERKETRDPIANESLNGLPNARGTIAMARTNDPDSATSQFYFNVTDNPELDPQPGQAGYTVFGEVTSGMDVIDQIAAAAVESREGFDDLPVDPVAILSVEVVEITAAGLELTPAGQEYVDSVEYRSLVMARNLVVQIVSYLLP